MGNIINSLKNCFKPNQDEYASFINNDNLLLDNIQDRINSYDTRTTRIEESISNMKRGYTSLIQDLKKEVLELRKEYNELESSNSHLNKEVRTIAILNKTQEDKINELENKLIDMESENIFLEDSNYLEPGSDSNYLEPGSDSNYLEDTSDSNYMEP